MDNMFDTANIVYHVKDTKHYLPIADCSLNHFTWI